MPWADIWTFLGLTAWSVEVCRRGAAQTNFSFILVFSRRPPLLHLLVGF